MEVSGKTIAVLGNGPAYVYPPQNKEIYKKILASGGAIVSEYPDSVEPDSEKFRQRNRIVSGISLGVLIVEARLKSGTSITARYAKEQGKDIFCIPSSRENIKGMGTNNLIRKGGTLVLEPSEILEKYSSNQAKQITIEELNRANTINLFDLNNIKKEYRKIYEVLCEPRNINEISLKTGVDITEVYSKIFMMELEGLIEKEGNRYIIKKG